MTVVLNFYRMTTHLPVPGLHFWKCRALRLALVLGAAMALFASGASAQSQRNQDLSNKTPANQVPAAQTPAPQGPAAPTPSSKASTTPASAVPVLVPGSSTSSTTPSAVVFPTKTRLESSKARDIVDRFQASWRLLVWPAGSTITGCFMHPGPELRATLVDAGRAWSRVANIHFDFGDAPGFRTCDPERPSDVRVAFAPGLISYSQIGTRALDFRPEQPTITITTGANGEEIVGRPMARIDHLIHELGHLLGLPHEHQHPASPCVAEYNLASLCPGAYEREKPNSAHAKSITSRLELFSGQRALIIDPEPQRLVPYDVRSVMHYVFPSNALRSGPMSACFSPGRNGLSPGDRAKMAVLYPQDPAQQRRMLRGELDALARALAHYGISDVTAGQIRTLVALRLARRYPDFDGRMDFSGLTFRPPSPETLAVEDRLTNPRRFLPAVCPL